MDKIVDNTKGFHFTIIDNYILDNASLNAMEQIVYVHLKKYSAQSNKCFPGINKLAKAIDISPNTIRKTLKSLKEKGFIDVQPRFNTSNEYTLLPYPEYVEEMKQDEGKEQKEEGLGRVLKSYQDNINPVYGSMEREKLISWYETFQGEADVLIKAIEMAVIQGVRKIKYIDSILINWHQSGINNIEQYENYQREWEERRENKDGIGGIGKNSKANSEKRYDFSKFGDI
jgi:DnaD/phage-associated family protein